MEEAAVASAYRGAKKLAVALLFCTIGVCVNLIGSQIAGLAPVPLFLDCIGTLLGAILGGTIPGIAVGYATNLVNTAFDPTTLYYGVVSVLIAVAAARFERRGWFASPPKTLAAVLVFALIGGALSSVITWWVFGFGFEGGASTPLAERIHAFGVGSEFLSQLLADFFVDLLDKTIVTAVALLVVRALPRQVRDACDFSIWQQTPLTPEQVDAAHASHPRGVSLRMKLASVIVVAMLIVGVATTAISYQLFRTSTLNEQSKNGFGITDMAAQALDPDQIDGFIERGNEAPGFLMAENSLIKIRDSFPNVEYLYVYQIREDGCHVVLDPDTATEEGSEPGEVIPFDDAFLAQKDALLAGRAIDPVVSNDSYGWLLSVYQPLYNRAGECKAYVAADISMESVVRDTYSFLAKVVSLLLSFFVLVVSVVLWLSEYSFVLPLNSIAQAMAGFAYDTEHERRETVEQLRALDVHTADEVENLYAAVLKTADDAVSYIEESTAAAQTIERMQNSLIMVMADLVESRDQYTGEHVRKTAAYCGIILAQVKREGIYATELTDEFISDVVHSAPLHDVGKIKVSDTILNKPGRLTDEEFAVMKAHTTEGRKIIEAAVDAVAEPGYLDEAKRLAEFHHEKWDGSGYPSGLSGEQIPLSARVMAVADVFDALVSKRSYKEGMPIDRALQIIREGAGSHFDPQVAEAFLHAEDEVRKVAEEHGDAAGTQAFDIHEQEGE